MTPIEQAKAALEEAQINWAETVSRVDVVLGVLDRIVAEDWQERATRAEKALRIYLDDPERGIFVFCGRHHESPACNCNALTGCKDVAISLGGSLPAPIPVTEAKLVEA